MPEIRTDLQDAFNLLCYQGQQFAQPQEAIEVHGATFEHPEKGELPIEVDWPTLARQGLVYTENQPLYEGLQEYNIPTKSWPEAVGFLEQSLQGSTVVWGFSGYATGGFNSATGEPFGYRQEAEGLLMLYDHLGATDQKPGLAIDGGVSEGFLALNSVIAQSSEVPTLGFIPKEGLASIGVRDHLVVAGRTYQDREALVGTADVLVCAGGAQGTIRECLTAARRGSAILLLALKDYPPQSLPNTFRNYQDLRQAEDAGRLVVSRTPEAIPQAVEQLLAIDFHDSRADRIAAIATFAP